MRRGAILPFLLLLGYATAFGAAGFGVSLPALDDHPGQMYRLWHALTHGLAPWTWNAGWWAGYPELQFYPPGFFWLGGALHWGSLGALSPFAIYRMLVWLTWLLPGVTAYVVLARLLGGGWPALPGAFVVLTLSAGIASGVEGGMHWGMLPARLAWSLLPLVLLAVGRWLQGPPGAIWPAAVLAPLLAAIVVTHPAHTPAAVVLIAVAALLALGERVARLITTTATLLLAAGLTALWTVPLLARIENTRALAWGRLEAPVQPLLIALLALAAGRWWLDGARQLRGRGDPPSACALVAWWPWAVAAFVAVDALALEPLGLRWLPADRVVDGAWMAVVLAAGVMLGRLIERAAPRVRMPVVSLAVTAVALLAALSLPGRALTLWPHAADWPSYASTAHGLVLDELWSTLRRAPPGRVLFVRSGVPLVFGDAWWRPHSHVTALAPIHAGREIVNGTFTHPSPVAAWLYRGSAGRGAIDALVERLDGLSLFGVPLERLDRHAFDERLERLGVGTVVAVEDDVPKLRALVDGGALSLHRRVGPFVLYTRRLVTALPERVDDRRWRVAVGGTAGAWVTTHLTYYPLWRAERAGASLPTRAGPAWDLEIQLDGGRGPVDLVYEAGRVEIAAALLSAAAVVAWLVCSWRALRARPSPSSR